ncbi:hypothetical protein JCGZ_10987 [Jatropha curcas]|uniref:Uncharacterized protein n=1 Tax=Jatropha curcas TaxID=180498 RepID=A0A067KGJ2_JATCU|nr:hypothetical protein JCGZ_10987 [Jatropha curcas]
MGSSSDEDVQILVEQSEDENTEAIDSGVGEAKGRKENIRVANDPSDIYEDELCDICFTYGMAPKKVKGTKKAKVVEAIKKNVAAESSNLGVPLVVLDPQPVDGGATADSTYTKHASESPSTKPSRKRLREVSIPAPPPLPPQVGETLDI